MPVPKGCSLPSQNNTRTHSHMACTLITIHILLSDAGHILLSELLPDIIKVRGDSHNMYTHVIKPHPQGIHREYVISHAHTIITECPSNAWLQVDGVRGGWGGGGRLHTCIEIFV